MLFSVGVWNSSIQTNCRALQPRSWWGNCLSRSFTHTHAHTDLICCSVCEGGGFVWQCDGECDGRFDRLCEERICGERKVCVCVVCVCLEISLLCRSLELFPKLLSVISTQPQIHHSRGHTTPTFTLYQTLYLTLPPSPLPPPSLCLQREEGWTRWRVQSSKVTS